MRCAARPRRVLASLAALLLSACTAVVDPGAANDYCERVAPAESADACRLAPPQCGCPEGTTCGLGQRCRPVGTLPLGASCAIGADECPAGSDCVGPPSFGAGHCQRFCTEPADCAPMGPESRCLLDPMLVPDPVGTCTVPCVPDPIEDGACGERSHCAGVLDVGLCIASGARGLGDPCGASAFCQAPFFCLPIRGESFCNLPCGPGFDACPDGLACGFPADERGDTLVPVERGQWGVCLIL